ncbi:MAG: 3-dehydroquinate synthase II, partial [Nitrososphaerales archaeon]
MASPEKEIVLDVTGSADTDRLLSDAKKVGIRRVISRSASAEVPSVEGIQVIRVAGTDGGADTAAWVEISGAKDMEAAVAASGRGHAFVVVQPENWRIIPLENLIADFHRAGKRIFAYMKTK